MTDRKQLVADDPTEKHLAAVIEWGLGNRGSKEGNPYGVPEIKAALQHLAELVGLKDYLNVDTKKIATPIRDPKRCHACNSVLWPETPKQS